jgi:mRNA interferase MazF
MKRGEVWWIELDPVRDNEILKTRPCVIVSPEVMIDELRAVIVAPVATGAAAASFRPPISAKDLNGLLLLDQIRAVDKSKLRTRLGRIEEKSLNEALTVLRAMFAE